MKNYLFNLRQFDGEGGNSGNAGQDSGNSVVYGKQYEEHAESRDADDKDKGGGEDRQAAFDALIKGEYKDLYDASVRQNIERRFKNSRDNEEQLQRYNEALTPIYERYGIEAGKFDELATAIHNDESLYAEEAERRGMTPEQMLYLKQQENARAQAEDRLQRLEGAQKAQEDYNRWLQEGETLKEMYPDFNLADEVSNERFMHMLGAGWTVQEAYEAVHAHELIHNGIGTAAALAEQRVVNNIKARNSRPTENGLGGRPGVIVKKDPSKFDNNDIEEVIRQVKSGKTIIF